MILIVVVLTGGKVEPQIFGFAAVLAKPRLGV